MAGAKTRFGFAGDGSEPPDSDEARSARTIIGHDIHLQQPTGYRPPGSSPPSSQFSVADVVPTPIPAPRAAIPHRPTTAARGVVTSQYPDENTEELPSRTGSRQGASRLARFLGRWTKSGRFVSDSRPSVSPDDLDIPRDPLARNVLVVLLVAALTFLITLALVKLRQHVARRPEPASVPALLSVPAAASPLAPAAARSTTPPPGAAALAGPSPEVAKASSAQPAAGPREQPGRVSPSAASSLAGRVRVPASAAAGPGKPQRPAFHAVEPPPHLKGELLPLGP